MPGNESPGERPRGNPHLRRTLIEAARAASRTKNTYLSSLYHRIAARRGANRAAMAVAHRILTIVYHLLKKKQVYQDPGPHYYEERRREQMVRQAMRKLEALGYEVTLKEREQPA